MIHILIKSLKSTNPEVRCKAADSLIELAKRCPVKFKAAAAGPLFKMSESEDLIVSCKAFHVLSHLMINDKQIRDDLLKRGIIDKLKILISRKMAPVDALRDISFDMMVLSSHIDRVALPKKYAFDILPDLKQFLRNSDSEVVYNATGALLALIECRNQFGMDYGFVDDNLIKELVRLLNCDHIQTRAYAFEALRNLAHYPEPTKMIFEADILKSMRKAINTPYRQIVIDALFIVSKIAVISKDHSQRIWGAGLTSDIIRHLSPPANQRDQIQAAQCIRILAAKCTPNQALYLLDQNVVENTCRILLEAEAKEYEFPHLKSDVLQLFSFIVNKLVDQEEFFRRLRECRCEKMFRDAALKIKIEG